MAARGNEVALEIERQIREAVEKMVSDIRSSVEDVRKAVDQQLDAALQSVQADANSTSFRPLLQRALTDFEDSLASPAPAAAPAAPPRPSAAGVRKAIQRVEQGKSQVEVLNALLDQTLEFGSRAALLILKGESFAGWKGVGFGRFGGNDEAIKRFTSPPGAVAELDGVLQREQGLVFDGASFAARAGISPPSTAALIPMVIKDKIAAVVYVDQLEEDEQKFDRSSLEVLVFTTGLLIDTLSIRKKIPSPTFSAEVEQEGEAAPPPRAAAPAPKPAPPAEPAAPPAAPRPTPPPAPAPTFGGTVAIPSFDASGTGRNRPASSANAAAAPAPAVTPAAPPAGGSFGDAESRVSTQYVPPPGLQRSGPLHSSLGDDGKKHDEARRFARLLVSEIKLYNESKVEQGRKNRDLYDRLKEDIDRSRQMYDERIAEDVRKASNYFYDELVRILADGDTEALGL
jgi:hypothetical protein